MATIVTNWLERLVPGCTARCLHLRGTKNDRASKMWSQALAWQAGGSEWEHDGMELQVPAMDAGLLAGLHLTRSEHRLEADSADLLREALLSCRAMVNLGRSSEAGLNAGTLLHQCRTWRRADSESTFRLFFDALTPEQQQIWSQTLGEADLEDCLKL